MRRRPCSHGMLRDYESKGLGPGDAGDRAEQRLTVASCGLLLAGAILLTGSWWLQASRQVEVASAMPSAGGGAIPADVAPAGGVRPAARWVVVEGGDTLWSLAVRYGPPGKDPRDLVEELSRLNDLSLKHPLKPGQAFRLPAGWQADR